MRYIGSQLVFSPSDLCTFAESEFASWMERCEKESPGRFVKDPTDEMMKVLQSKGHAHEAAILRSYENQRRQIVNLAKGSLEDTKQAMRAGVDVIYQATLAFEQFAGRADFLIKVPGRSTLGDYCYEVWDCKLSRSTKPASLIQLCAYVNMLESIQGRRPERIGVILGTGEEKAYRTHDYYFYYYALKKRFLEFQAQFSLDHIPDPVHSHSFGSWETAAKQILAVKDSVFQVARITRTQTKRLAAAGIHTMAQLGQLKDFNIKGIAPDVLRRLAKQCEVQIRSRGKAIPDCELISEGEEALSQLPPADSGDLFFDMEGFPLVVNGLEYLWGYVCLDGSKPRFECIWAHNADQEREALKRFVDLVHERWLKHPQMHVYHYASYETRALKHLAQRYGRCEAKLDDLLRNNVFVDLYQIVRNSFVIGSDSYSIKVVEHLYRPYRNTDVANAAASVVYYQNWLDASALGLPSAAAILEDIRKYNEDDCQSTYELTVWLRQQMEQNGISSKALSETKAPEPVEAEVQELIRKLEGAGEVGILLSQLLFYHKREMRCEYWEFFARFEMTSEELFDDPDSIAGLVHDGNSPEKMARSLVYTYTFDPTQEVKAQVDDSFCLKHDRDIKVTIVELNQETGELRFKTSSKDDLPAVLDLVPQPPRPNQFEKIIREYAKVYVEGARHKALDSFLNRQFPRLKNGIRLPESAELTTVEAIIQVISAMDDTSLVIQGPPGAGKTYAGSQAIAELCRKGKRIGIMSNSHKAIDNLLAEATRCLKSDSNVGKIIKIGPPVAEMDIDVVRSGSGLGDFGAVSLVGGTVYAFAGENFRDQFDYLFIDEASQVCVANLIAASGAAKNFVFLGDQMQLAQPAKGSHPGDSGLSCLEYYLKGQATVSLDQGIFLPITRRLHPSICRFISDAVYEGRLDCHPCTNARMLIPSGQEVLVRETSGIHYLPVSHSGNRQSSEEEAQLIQKVVKELLNMSFAESTGTQRPLTKNDILVVSPYNMQVRLLQTKIGREFRIASVDKFQGQEAPVVIFSLGASSVHEAPR
ncbi:MAG TPA: TM0106 family RecB-like putative nuclease, partial [Oligoflexus sp.]|uniref:TM0106 family RecB-like putative nuclease n=1 Tax=Oligoflexus sp. TaxID=1971216 RepID=UPI002D7F8311